MGLKNYTWDKIFSLLIVPSLLETIKMLLISGILATLIGFLIGVVLVGTRKDGLFPNRVVHQCLDLVVNVIRSFPFIILMISIIPLTRLIVGTSIGDEAAIIPLTVAAAPFMGRIEAAKSFGASKIQIIFKVMFVEAIPSIISGLSLSIINLLGATAMAGAIGAGGLGATALQYGYQNFNEKIMYSIVVILIILVIFIQYFGDWLYKKLK